MNLEQMEKIVKRYGFDSTDPLIEWINAAMRDVESGYDWSFLQGAASLVNTTPKSAALALPERTSKVILVRDATNLKKLRYWDTRRFAREVENPASEGLPEIYTIPTGNASLNLYPVPQGAYSIEVIIQQLTKDLVNPGDEPEVAAGLIWPESLHYLIPMKAAIIALFAENEEERGKTLQSQYNEMLETQRRKFGEAVLDEPSSVQDVQGYGPDSVGSGAGYGYLN